MYRRDIIEFLFNEFDVDVCELTVSRMLQREKISRKRVCFHVRLFSIHLTYYEAPTIGQRTKPVLTR